MVALLGNTKRLVFGFILAAVVIAAAAWWFYPRQTLPGRLTDYHKTYQPFWDVACDTAMDGSDARCYIQYVEVYRSRPEFAAAMVEVVFHEGDDGQPDPHICFDFERGLSLAAANPMLETGAGAVPLEALDCTSNSCLISGNEARAMLSRWREARALTLTLEERGHDTAQLSWPLNQMGEILDDLQAQRQARNLP